MPSTLPAVPQMSRESFCHMLNDKRDLVASKSSTRPTDASHICCLRHHCMDALRVSDHLRFREVVQSRPLQGRTSAALSTTGKM